MPSGGDIAEAFVGGWVWTWPTKLLSMIWLAWVISWVVASFWSGRTKAHVPISDSWVYWLPIVLGWIMFLPLTERLLGAKQLYHPGNVGTYLLAIVVVLGIAFTWWGRIHLGRLWSNAITHKEDHRIIDTGPYAVVRHPIYTGQIIALVASAIAIATWTALVGVLLISFGQWQKARLEERFLKAELGAEAYGAYSRRVPMILPFGSRG